VKKTKLLGAILIACFACQAWGATFGTVVQIGGHASDLALDERRGLLYVANFTANRIEVISTANLTLGTPIKVAAQPASLALSADCRYLVVGHYSTWAFGTVQPTLTIFDLDNGFERKITTSGSPLAVAFGSSAQALVITTDGFYLLDPGNGILSPLQPGEMGGQQMPAPLATFPPEIVQASAGVSGDKRFIVGAVGTKEQDVEKTVHFRFNVETGQLGLWMISSQPPLGPRVVSVDREGKNFLLGWALYDYRLAMLAEFPHPAGKLNVGGHAYDWVRSLIYAQIPEQGSEQNAAPVLHVVDSDNLTVREQIQLPENLAGRALLNSDQSVMYSVSDSGVMVLPIGRLHEAPRVAASVEDVLFRGSFCDRRPLSQEFDIVDAGGGRVDFRLSTTMPGITLSQTEGTTPARIKVTVDPTVYKNLKGTTAGKIEISSRAAVNLPQPVRILVNTREPDQRGVLFNVPGKLVDILADPVRDRFYILRQDKNLVLVYNATTFERIAALRTANTPTQMAITADLRWLLVGHEHAQIAKMFDLDTLQPSDDIVFPGGHYPHSIAASANAILAAVRSVAEGPGCPNGYGLHTIDQVDLAGRRATILPSLGIYCNDISEGTVLAATPLRSAIFAAMNDGNLLLYDDEAATFVVSRKDFSKLGGAIAALSDRIYVVDNYLLNSSLVSIGALETGTGKSSGFVIHDGEGLRTTAPSADAPGIIQRVNLERWSDIIRPVKMIEAPLVVEAEPATPSGQIGQSILPFSRTLIVTSNRNFFVSLSVSGFVVLPWDFDAWVAKPVIESVANLADGTAAVASGGLISVLGRNMSRMTIATNELPLPTTLGEACLMAGDVRVPLFMISPGQINAQMPFEVQGAMSLVLRTAGGVSDPFQLTVAASAPAVFQTAEAGPEKGLAALYRAANNQPVTLANPIHPRDYLVIYVTGLGRTSPPVASGYPAPADPLAQASILPSVKLGNVALPVLYAGLVPGLVGVYQINVYVPEEVPRGMEIPLVISRPDGDLAFSVRVVK